MRVLPCIALAACSSSLVAYDAALQKEGNDAPADGTLPSETDADADVDADTDADIDPVQASLVQIDPWYGTVGHVVRITGGPFSEPVEVTFDGVEADVVSVREDEIEVEIPDLTDDVLAAVEVSTDAGTADGTLEFQFFQDGAGKIGAIGSIEWNDLRGTYWDAASVDVGVAQVMFTLPTDMGWPELIYSPVIEHCELNYVPADTVYVYDPGLPSIDVTAGATVHTLPSDPTYPYVFFDAGIDVAEGWAYDLEPMSGNATWPDFALSELTGELPSSLDITFPPLDGTTPARVARQFTLQWGPPFDGDGVLVWMVRQRFDDTLPTPAWVDQEEVSCWLQDDGSFALPSLWTDWQTDDGILIYVGRYHEPDNVVMPHNNATSAVIGSYWTVGYLLAN
jgi:hypothetical protein